MNTQAYYPTQMDTEDERVFATLCHLGGLLGTYVIPMMGNVLCPLLIWMLKKKESRYVDRQGREVLNFQLSMFLFFLITGLIVGLSFLFGPLGALLVGSEAGFLSMLGSWVILFVLMIFMALFQLVMGIVGTIAAYRGHEFRYPFTIRFF